MNSKSMSAVEALNRIETIEWVAHAALLSMERYRKILEDPAAFDAVFPGMSFENPKITHAIEDVGVVMTTTKRELLEPRNHDLYKGWQIVLAITGMSSILDNYLRSTAWRLNGEDYNAIGIFSQFSRITGIKISEFKRFEQLRHFHEVRNISLHNLSRINQRFRDRTSEHGQADGPYVFYPRQISDYRQLLANFLDFVESRALAKGGASA